ncbi:hypothetical protein BC834DRAFT_59557 [Gloeopeniophorella convolvens]|nr:hypothetical protein BC834DRAFT_59557 [Gloeopeniophorella convolvens]
MPMDLRTGGIDSAAGLAARSVSPLGHQSPHPTPQQKVDQSTPVEGPEGAGFGDGSAPLLSMYLAQAEDMDRRMVENWKGDADGILIFTGLFSASVATFLGNTYQNLQISSQDASAFYLARIYQQSASENGSHVPIVPTLSDPSFFTPSRTTVWVNALWFLSLVMSLTCALLATMLQQWARHYLHATQTRYQPHKRARIRSFFAIGVQRFRVSWAVDALPALLHLSVFLFFAGLSILLFTANLTVFKVVIPWMVLCGSLYLVITVMPVIVSNSPYNTPLSTIAWIASIRMSLAVLPAVVKALTLMSLHRLASSARSLQMACLLRFKRGPIGNAEAAAMDMSSQVDSQALAFTWESLDGDHEVEQFLAGIPGFLSSQVIEEPTAVLAAVDSFVNREHIFDGALSLVFRTIRSGPITTPARRRRCEVSFKTAFVCWDYWSDWLHNSWRNTGVDHYDLLLLCEELAKTPDQDIAFVAQCLAAAIIDQATPEELIRVVPILERQLCISQTTLYKYVESDVGIANIQVASTLWFIRNAALPYIRRHRRAVPHETRVGGLRYPHDKIKKASPDLQNEFCRLWNEVARVARGQGDIGSAEGVLRCLRRTYDALHNRTRLGGPPEFLYIGHPISSYPLCIEDSHHHTHRDTPQDPASVRAGTELAPEGRIRTRNVPMGRKYGRLSARVET